MTQEAQKKLWDWNKVEIGEDLGSFEYTLTQAQVDNYRKSVDDPEAPFTTIAVKHEAVARDLLYTKHGRGGINARTEIQFFNPPIPGNKIKVTARVADKYVRRDLPYLVVEAMAKDEEGRPIEMVKTYHMHRPEKVGEKWAQQLK